MSRARPAVVDVIVAGAGPAGCAAALTLARAGARVVLLDKARFPRDKCCGDGLTGGALRRLEGLKLDPRRVASWVRVDDVVLRSPAGRSLALQLPDDAIHAAVATRSDLDSALVDLAGAEPNVDLRTGSALESVSRPERGVAVDTAAGSVQGAYLIAADGAWSATRKALGMPVEREAVDRADRQTRRRFAPNGSDVGAYRGEWHAMRQYFSDPEGGSDRRLWVWFEPDLLPGYAWSFPVGGGRLNVGIAIPRRPGWKSGSMAKLWSGLLHRPHIRQVLGSAGPEATVRAWPIPASGDESLLSGAGGRVLFAGDAARLADPMTGEGIGQALESGIAAAEAVLAVGDSGPGPVAGHYRHSLSGLHLDNRLAAGLTGILAHPLGARAALRTVGLSGWTASQFGRWMFEDYPRAVLATPGRWRRRMLSPAGAYATLSNPPRPRRLS